VTANPPALDAATRFINRELSWLDFNERVLAQAADPTLPVLERAKFLAIFANNLDEFYQVRVAGLKDQVAAGLASLVPDGATPSEQLRAIRVRVEELVAQQTKLFHSEIAPGLEEVGIRFSDWRTLDDDDREHLVEIFNERIFPVLTPLAVDPAHPFPYISNLSLNLAVVVLDPRSNSPHFARVKVPPILPRFVVMPDGERFVPLEQVIAAHLDQLFPGMEIIDHYPFRVTRNADVNVEEEEAGDLLAAVENELSRRRFRQVVRLEVETGMSSEILGLLTRELEITSDEIIVTDGPLDLAGLWSLYELDRPELKYDAWLGITPPRFGPGSDVFAAIRDGDILLHHPYDAFGTTVEAFIAQAARDPSVLAIKQTLYRTSGPDSPILRSLIAAAEEGKQAVVLVEVKARWDEEANIGWARALEETGVHVVYGLVGLKTHCKIALVVREEQGHIRRYVHIGTGNYNHRTARQYEDLGLLTCDPDIGADVSELFNFLTGYSHQHDYRRLLVAPVALRREMLELIRREADAGDGRIVMKMNSLVDAEIIDALYEAARVGVDIDLIVRGICCLRPGVDGLSERIRVRSIVGRYLEHARIYRFGSEARGVDYFFGSADLMPRNLSRRVEALAPVTDPALQAQLEDILRVNLADDALAWTLDADGRWRRVETVEGVNTHATLQAMTLGRNPSTVALTSG